MKSSAQISFSQEGATNGRRNRVGKRRLVVRARFVGFLVKDTV